MRLFLIAVSITISAVTFIGANWLWRKRFGNVIDARRARRVTQFELLSGKTANVVFLGDSITGEGLWHELFPDTDLINRGVDGDTTSDVLARIDQIFKLKPERLFLMIGVNDLNKKCEIDFVLSNYKKLFDLIDQNIPECKMFVQSVLPVNDTWKLVNNRDIADLNSALRHHAAQRAYTYIDLHTVFSDSNGQLRQDLTNDGIHLLGAGYERWRSELGDFLGKEKILNTS